ncbi:MAG: glycosyltransferase [Chitinophagaceae bacterium]|nr:glycosyltransferase [Chitinophagaceae bacterium]
MKKRVVIIGPAWPLRGGLASFDERVARQFMAEGYETIIYTFSLQYPGFLFPGTTQYSTEPAPADLDIRVRINSINPINWLTVGREIRHLKADIVLTRFWLPMLGPCLGTLLRIIKKNRHSKLICLVDNIIPHEHRAGDTAFTRYFVKPVDGFVTMSEKVTKDLAAFSSKPVAQTVHPLFDNFGAAVSKEEAREKLGLPVQGKIILFFGFIRKYKGLDLLLQAMQEPAIREAGIKLLIAGEFYEDRKEYDALIDRTGIAPQLLLRTDFISNSEVRYYLSAADFVIQPYRHATQSGVTPLAYHFEKPMLVTDVGGLPELVPDHRVGIVTAPEPAAIARGILELYRLGEAFFLPQLKAEKNRYGWDKLTNAVTTLAETAW